MLTPKEEIEQKRRFAKGDKVLAPCVSRRMPLAEVLEIYEAANGRCILYVAYLECPTQRVFVRTEEVAYVGERKFIASGMQIYQVSTGDVVVSSVNWAPLIADFLETVILRGECEAEAGIDSQAYAKWRALNVE